MILASLISGGKDSNLALIKALEEGYEIKCLLNLIPSNNYSYMFQTVNVNLTKLQSICLEIPLLQQNTKGEKEKELKDLELLLKKAKKEYNIEGIVSGALKSNYQKDRIDKIASKLGLKVFNPLWEMDWKEEFKELKKYKFEMIISRVGSYPLSVDLLGKNFWDIEDFLIKNEKYINVNGEGGEYETSVLYNKYYKKRIEIEDYEIKIENEYVGDFIIKKAKLVEDEKNFN